MVGAVVTAVALAVVWWSPSYDGGSRVNRPDHSTTEISWGGGEAARGGDPADGGRAAIPSEDGQALMSVVNLSATD